MSAIDSIIVSPTEYMGNIFSGVSIGVLIALVAVFITPKNLILGFVIGLPLDRYIAYGFAYLAGVSAVTASLASVILFVSLGLYKGFWPHNKIKPTPLNTWSGFGFLLILFLLLGWQTHQPISAFLILEVVLGCGIGALVAWIGQQKKLPSFTRKSSISRVGLRVVLLLGPALLLWPRGIIQQPVLLAFALGTAGMVLALSRIALDYIFEI